MEDAWMGKAVERIFLPLMKLTIPEVVDINLPVEGIFHNLMIVSIKKSYPGQARKVMARTRRSMEREDGRTIADAVLDPRQLTTIRELKHSGVSHGS